MGRCVYELMTGKFVWKYVFGAQPSEQYRIAEELGVGTIIYPHERKPYCRYKESFDEECPDECPGDDCPHYGDWLIIKRGELPEFKKRYKRMLNRLLPKLITLHMEAAKHGISLRSFEFDSLVNKLGLEDYYWFLNMVKAYIKFMEEHPEIEEFVFEGEY